MWSDQVFEGEHLAGIVESAEPVLDQRHDDAAREVLVYLYNVDVGRSDARLAPQPRGDRREAGARIIRIVVQRCSGSVSAALRHREHVHGRRREIPRPLRCDQDHRRGSVVLLAAVVEPVGLDDPA